MQDPKAEQSPVAVRKCYNKNMVSMQAGLAAFALPNWLMSNNMRCSSLFLVVNYITFYLTALYTYSTLYPASRGFWLDTTLLRERNHCQQPFASLISYHPVPWTNKLTFLLNLLVFSDILIAVTSLDLKVP